MFICDHRFHAILLRQSSGREKISIYLLLHNSSITDIEHSPNHTAFGLPQTHQVR